MNVLSRTELRTLVDQQGGPCVSLYMPTHEGGADIQQDPIRYKNLLRDAESRLRELGLRDRELQALMEPAWKLMESRLAWRRPQAGFAMFLAGGVFQHFDLPMKVDDLVVVSDRFHIKPLLKMFGSEDNFYVLALSQDRARLLECTRFTAREVPLRTAQNMDQALLRFIEANEDLRLNNANGAPDHTNTRSGMFTGHGASPEDVVGKKERYREFFVMVDQDVREVLGTGNAPLVLAGVEYLFPIYGSANKYAHLLPEGIAGNQELVDDTTLLGEAWRIVRPYLTAEERNAAAKFENLTGTGKTSTDLNEILAAASEGRVESLFVAVGVEEWGRYDYSMGQMEVHEAPKHGDSDLLDLAAAQSLMNGARVFAVDPGAVPGAAPAAAIFRY